VQFYVFLLAAHDLANDIRAKTQLAQGYKGVVDSVQLQQTINGMVIK